MSGTTRVWARYELAVLLNARPNTTTDAAADALGISASEARAHRVALQRAGFDQMSEAQRRAHIDSLREEADRTLRQGGAR